MEGESESATKGLLSDYSITPGTSLPMRTPRTPATQDTILQVFMTNILLEIYLPRMYGKSFVVFVLLS